MVSNLLSYKFNYREADMRGFFITFEGLEGSGKSTQARILYDKLSSIGYPCVLTSEPGGTQLGEAIRAILIDNKYRDMTPLAELYLFAASRVQHVDRVIRPSLEEGKIVICDRFTDASIAYQSFGRGLSETLIRETSSVASWNVRPNLTLFLDIDPGKGLYRVSQRLQELELTADRIEKEGLSFFERVREGYHYIAREEPQRFRILDADQAKEDVASRIYEVVDKELIKIKFDKNLRLNLPVDLS
jgi:dTMP kinase